MANLRITAPDGKTLNIQIPPGTTQDQYGAMVDDVISHYKMQQIRNEPGAPDTLTEQISDIGGPILKAPEVGGELATEKLGEMGAPPAVSAAVGTGIQMLPYLGAAKAGIEAAPAMAEGIAAAPGAISRGLERLTMGPEEYGATSAMGKTPMGAQRVANIPSVFQQPQTAAEQAILKSQAPESTQALINRSAQNVAKEPISSEPPVGFSQPISSGLGTSAKEMSDTLQLQQNQIGAAMGRELQKLNATGTQFDPKPILDKLGSAYEKDVNGQIIDPKYSEINKNISEVLDKIKAYSSGEPMDWDMAARIKTLLQKESSYRAGASSMSNEAYKMASGILKDGIDEQAQTVMQKMGGNADNYKNLRQIYGQNETALQAISSKVGAEAKAGTPMQQAVRLGLKTAKAALPIGAIGGIAGAMYKALQ